jgi:hypothetical protein
MGSISLKYLIDQGVDPSRTTVYLAEFESHTLASKIQWFIDSKITCGEQDKIPILMSTEEQRQFYGDTYCAKVIATEKNDKSVRLR